MDLDGITIKASITVHINGVDLASVKLPEITVVGSIASEDDLQILAVQIGDLLKEYLMREDEIDGLELA